nr:MAG TPA: hypothetical protein [Caudoviricetes sp.]
MSTLRSLSSGACIRVERLHKSFFLILGELTYYWLGNYYSEYAMEQLCRELDYEVVDFGHRVFYTTRGF